MANVSNLIVRFVADTTNIKAQMRSLENEVTSFGAKVNSAAAMSNSSFASVGTTMVKLGNTMGTAGAILTRTLTVPLALLGAAALKTGIDFETAFAGVRKTIDTDENGIAITEQQFAELAKSLSHISMRTGVAVKDTAAIMQMAGQLGIRGNTSLSKFTEVVSKLTITTGVASDQLSMMLGKFTAISGTNIEQDIEKIGSVITALGNTTATEEKSILKFGVRIAAIGRLSGMSAADILALGAAAESSGTKAERGGTAMTKIFLAIRREAIGAKAATEEFNKEITSSSGDLVYWNTKLTNLLAEQKSLGPGASSEDMSRVSEEIANAQEMVNGLTETIGSYKEAINGTGAGIKKFSDFLGMTDKQFKDLYFSTGGATRVFELFLDRVGKGLSNNEDIESFMKSVGLSDSRLIQAVLSLAKANEVMEDGTRKSSAFSEALLTARAAFIESTGDFKNALDVEVIKRLDTVSGQWGVLKEILKTIAKIMTSSTNKALKDFLKTINTLLVQVVDKLENSPELVSKLTKGFAALLALGPGLSLLSIALKSFGTSFQLIGIGMSMFGLGADDSLKKMNKWRKSIADTILSQDKWVVNLTPRDPDTQQFMDTGGMTPSQYFKTKDKNFLGNYFGVGGENDVTPKEPAPYGPAPLKSKTKIGRFIESSSIQANTMGKGMADDVAGVGAKLAGGMKSFVGGLSPMLKSFIGLVGKVSVGMMGWVAIIAIVAAAFTAFFMTSGKSMWKFFGDIMTSIKSFTTRATVVIWKFVTESFPKFAGEFGKVFSAVLDELYRLGITLINSIFIIGPRMFDALVLVLNTMLTGFVDALPQMLDMVIGWTVAAVSNLVHVLPGLLADLFSLISNVLGNLFEALPQILAAAIELIWKVGYEIITKTDWIGLISVIIGGVWDMINSMVVGLILGLSEAVPRLIDAALGIFSDMLNAILEFFGIHSPSTVFADIGINLLTGLWEGLKWYWDTTLSILFNLGKWVMDLLVGAGTWLYDTGKSILKGVWDGLWWYWTNVFKVSFKVGTWLVDIFSGSVKWLYDSGVNIVKGLLAGIGDWAGKIGTWFLNKLPSWIVDPFKSALGIRSPSRVFMGFGNMIGQGLINGLDEMQNGVMGASDAIAQAAMIDPAALNQAMSIDGGTIQHDFGGLAESLAGALESVGLNVYMDGKKVTDVVSTQLALDQRRVR